ncbi:MAG: L-Ala-D/L-Glu epimerase [Planctomycetes bacterium]|nr:L-Ala-D/L-Glu epimerase [Planctomycetota bacterium]
MTSIRIRTLERQSWPLRGTFRISRGARTAAEVLYLELGRGTRRGHAECVPYAHYGETFESVLAQVEHAVAALHGDDPRSILQELLPAGAARNAVDCALWDLLCKERGVRAWELAGRPEPTPAITVETVVIDTPAAMRAAAHAASHRPVLKIKLDAEQVVDRVAAVRDGAPRSRLVVDANEAWSIERLADVAPALAELGVVMIEQPLPAADDSPLAGFVSPVPLCADESCHTRRDLDRCAGRYAMVNLKLDKTGGLTEALALADAARARGFGLMVGCMLGTSLAMAPATLVADRADVVDLDGPLWIVHDRQPALTIDDSRVGLPAAALWG